MLKMLVEKQSTDNGRNWHRLYYTHTLLLKSKILDFENLNHVHVYRIEYVSYRQGPYRIHIVLAADRIVLALIYTAVYI